MGDKIGLQDYIQSISDQFLGAVTAIEKKYAGWQFDPIQLTLRVALIPGPNGKDVLADTNEPDHRISEVSLRIIRKNQ